VRDDFEARPRPRSPRSRSSTLDREARSRSSTSIAKLDREARSRSSTSTAKLDREARSRSSIAKLDLDREARSRSSVSNARSEGTEKVIIARDHAPHTQRNDHGQRQVVDHPRETLRDAVIWHRLHPIRIGAVPRRSHSPLRIPYSVFTIPRWHRRASVAARSCQLP